MPEKYVFYLVLIKVDQQDITFSRLCYYIYICIYIYIHIYTYIKFYSKSYKMDSLFDNSHALCLSE